MLANVADVLVALRVASKNCVFRGRYDELDIGSIFGDQTLVNTLTIVGTVRENTLDVSFRFRLRNLMSGNLDLA